MRPDQSPARMDERSTAAISACTRLRLHDDRDGAPIALGPQEPRSEEAISRVEFQPLHRPPEDTEWAARGEDLKLKGCAAAERPQKRRDERFEDEGWGEPTEEAQLPCSLAVRDLREAHLSTAPLESIAPRTSHTVWTLFRQAVRCRPSEGPSWKFRVICFSVGGPRVEGGIPGLGLCQQED